MGGAASIGIPHRLLGGRSSPAALAAWHQFDLQLTTYAALLAALGLAMAYSNSVEAGRSLGEASPLFLRAVLWTSIAVVVFVGLTTFDHRWLRTFTWPLYFEDVASGPAVPYERIDLIFTRGVRALKVDETGTDAPFASDHAGVVASFHVGP